MLSSLMPVGAVEPPAVEPLRPSEDGVVRAEMTIDSYSYKPDHLIVPVGRTVELTLKSVTIIVPHNFVVKAPEIGVEINQEVPAGKTVTIRFTPTRAGKAEIYCDKKLLFFKSHKKKGMVATLEVIEPLPD
jgi:plastocyanin